MNDDDANRWSQRHKERTSSRRAKRTQPGPPVSGSSHEASAAMTAVRGRALSPAPLSDDLVTVSMAWRDTSPTLVDRALASVLDGAHRHVRIVVVDEAPQRRGELRREVREDPRVLFVTDDADLGDAYIHDAVLRSRPQGLLAIQRPQDTSTPDRLHRQLAALYSARADVAISPVIETDLDGATRIAPCSTSIHPLYGHHAPPFGVFNGPSLMRLAGIFGGFRDGYEVMVTSALCILGRVVVTKDALYRRFGDVAPPTSTESGDLADLYRTVYRAAQTSPLSGLQSLSEIVRVRTRPHDKLARELARRIKAASRSISPPPACDALLNAVLRAAPSSGSPITDALARRLYRHCEGCRPQTILDVAPGIATFVFALYAGRHEGVRVVSVESDPARHAKISEALATAGLRDLVDLKLSPLKRIERRPRGYMWYALDLPSFFPDGIDFTFIDGPNDAQSPARDGALFQLEKALRPGATVWMHDGASPTGVETVGAWRSSRQIEANLLTTDDPKGVWELALR